MPGFQTNSEPILEKSIHFSCTLIYFSQPPYVAGTKQKNSILDTFNTGFKYKMHCRSSVPPTVPPFLPTSWCTAQGDSAGCLMHTQCQLVPALHGAEGGVTSHLPRNKEVQQGEKKQPLFHIIKQNIYYSHRNR